MNGHKFVARQFYQIMMCAYCGDFLLKASGYQCEDCRYTCHRECYPKVVTKCISKSNAETVRSRFFLYFHAAKISYELRRPTKIKSITEFLTASKRSPTFELIGVVTVAICSPLGARTPRNVAVSPTKITFDLDGRLNFGLECDITCHASCAHLVPDFCGMTMEKANILLHQIQEIKSHQRQIQPKPKKSQSYQQQPQPQNWGLPTAPPAGPDLYHDLNNMRISGKNGHGRTDSGGSGTYPVTGPPGGSGMPGSPQPLPAKPGYDAPPYRTSIEMDPGVPGLVSEPARHQSSERV